METNPSPTLMNPHYRAKHSSYANDAPTIQHTTHTHTHTLQHQDQLTPCSALTTRGNDWNCCQLAYPLNHMLVDHVRVNSNESLQHAELVGLVNWRPAHEEEGQHCISIETLPWSLHPFCLCLSVCLSVCVCSGKLKQLT